MEKRQVPRPKGEVQYSPKPVRVALPSSCIHNVSSSRNQTDAQRDCEMEPLSGNLPNMILLSMLEQLEAKLDNLQNTLEGVPSRVAGLMEQIWIAKGLDYLENGGVSLEMASAVVVRDYPLSRSPPINLSVRAKEENQCLQSTSPPGRDPQPDQCLQPTSPHGHEPKQSRSFQPLSPAGPHQDGTGSRCPPPDVQVIPGEQSLRLPPRFDDGQEPQQDQCIQLVFPVEQKQEEHVKKEPLYADSWGAQQNVCLQPLFHEGHEPQQNHCTQPVLPDGEGPSELLQQELLWFDGDGQRQNLCRQPAFQEDQSLQLNTCLQVLSNAHEPHQNCKTEPMHLEALSPDRGFKLEPPSSQDYDQNYKQEPLGPEGYDQNYKQEPLGPEDRDENSDLQPTCADAQGPSGSSSFLPQNAADTDGAITTDPLERGNTDADGLLLKAIPAQQSQTESMNGKEKRKASGGRKNFAYTMNERKHQGIQRSENFNNKTVLARQKTICTGLRAYACAECKKTFTRKTHLLLHEQTHTDRYPYTEHEMRFADKATHEKTHSGELPFHYNICEKSFTRKGNLQHQSVHTGERPYHCTVCSNPFSQKTHLVLHQRTHTGEQPYHCIECSKRFAYKGSLVGHQRTHTGERPYHCTVCSKCFAHQTNLVLHQRTHTGERPYHCTVCSKSFSRKATLVRHQSVHT
ncbi:uncharacterized protein LOC144762828 [Lissotriton helveticus]